MIHEPQRYVVAVDVGTGSARAGVFSGNGQIHAHASHAIALERRGDHVEQDSEDIWSAVCHAVREAVSASGVASEAIEAIAFDATCSLVLRDKADKPLTLSEKGSWDIIVWMDQRATKEAEDCNKTGSQVLDYVGGAISPQMEIPKLTWLKRHRPDLWARLGAAYDLADFLSWRASGSNARSVCTLTCKWTYLSHSERPWDEAFFKAIDMADLRSRTSLPDRATPVGKRVGTLTPNAARELGLSEKCVVAAGLIDAHAGALGTLARELEGETSSRMALIAGTSNCHMVLSRNPRTVPGVWGPYKGVIGGAWWLHEGGQTATGALLDFIVQTNAQAAQLKAPHDEIGTEIVRRISAGDALDDRMHVIPDFLGNRSPYADPDATGAMLGLRIEDPVDHMVKLYWASAVSIAYGTRQIIDRLNTHGYAIDTIALSGGHAASELLRHLYADVTGCKLVLAEAPEPVLLGTAMTAAVAGDLFPTLEAAASGMAQSERTLSADPRQHALHNKRYGTFEDWYRPATPAIDRRTAVAAVPVGTI